MILRNIAIRHGRKALAAPLQRSCLRPLSTQSGSINPTTQDSLSERGAIQSNIIDSRPTSTHTPQNVAPADNSVVQNHETYLHVKTTTKSFGSSIDPYYEPHTLVNNPPSAQDVTLELLLASQTHMGHATSHWHPANQRYIYGVRDGIHVISLEATAAHLRRAAKVVEGVAYHGGIILFIGTRPGQGRCIVKAAQMSKGYHLFERWVPGTITNAGKILQGLKIKAIDELDLEVEHPYIDAKILENKPLKPDLMVCLNPLENYISLHECGLNNIPTIGIIDTNTNPTWVTYPIPANDDSLRSVQLIAGVLGRAGELGQRKRLEAARTGEVTWDFSDDKIDIAPPS